MRGALLCAVLAVVGVPVRARAQSVILTESEALMRLSTDGVRVNALRTPIDVSRADVLAAGRYPNPRVSIERQAVAGVTEYYASVSQLLPITGRRRFDVEAASALVSARSSRVDDDVRRLRAELRLAFAGLVAAQARVRDLSAARDRMQDLGRILAARERSGDAAGFDRLRAEREVLDLESDLVIATTDRARAQATLAGFYGDPLDASQIVAADRAAAAPAVPVPALEALLAQAETTRGALAAFRHEADAARLAALSARTRRLPEPELFAGTKSSTAGSASTGAVTIGSGAIGPLVGVQATIPLFDRGKPELALATARAAQAEADASSFRTVLRAEVAALREAVLQRRAAADRYRADGVGGAADIERIAQVSYDAGERGILDLLDAYRLGVSARVHQSLLDLAVRQAEIELEFATGWEGRQ